MLLLQAAAQGHCTDMSNNNFFSHTGSDGSQPWDRMSRAGYSWNFAGENIAVGQTSVADVMSSWMNSPGHRANILDSGFSHVGVARVGNYWAQVFGDSSVEGCS